MTRVGIVGGFDAANFGDVLFPELAQRELSARLPDLELVRYGYRELSERSWFYPVRSLGRLRDDVHDLDLVIVGGGQIVRLDPLVAAGYLPDDPRLHHPTALWILPALLAAAANVPVAYNAPGVSDLDEAWARPLIRATVAAIDHLTVRDADSADRIRAVVEDADVTICPDTAVAIDAHVPDEPSADWRAFTSGAGIDGPYVVLQCSPTLRPFFDRLRPSLERALSAGVAILALQSGPILGDDFAEVPPALPVNRAPSWPAPLLLAEVLARAEAVVAQSFHMTLAGAGCGVPANMPASWPGFKWTALEPLRDVHPWSREDPEPIELVMGRRAPAVDIRNRAGQVAAHWDAVAALAGARSRRGSAAVAGLITELPHLLSAPQP